MPWTLHLLVFFYMADTFSHSKLINIFYRDPLKSTPGPLEVSAPQFANHCFGARLSLVYNRHTICPTNILLILESSSIKNTIRASLNQACKLWNSMSFTLSVEPFFPLMSYFGSELVPSGTTRACCPRAQCGVQTHPASKPAEPCKGVGGMASHPSVM